MNKKLAIREKQHRLPREFYIGRISVALTICVKDKVCLFSDTEVIKKMAYEVSISKMEKVIEQEDVVEEVGDDIEII